LNIVSAECNEIWHNEGYWCLADPKGFWWMLVHFSESTNFQQQISQTLFVRAWQKLARLGVWPIDIYSLNFVNFGLGVLRYHAATCMSTEIWSKCGIWTPPIPCANFTKFAESTPFQDALAVKISLALLKGLWSYGGFKLTGSCYPQILSTRRNYASDTKCFRGARTCSRSSVTVPTAKFIWVWISSAIGVAKNIEFVCLSVTLLNLRACVPNFAMKALDYRNDFDTVG